MPVSVIVGGQFGSEGKGKASAYVARERKARAIIRVGGTNSGHTAVDSSGARWTLRQLPAGLVESPAVAILPAGSLIDVDILLAEIERLKLSPDRLWIDTRASIITPGHRTAEQALIGAIGSTSSGTGAALSERLARRADHVRAASISELGEYLCEDTVGEMRTMLQAGDRLVIEGTQGFGLSIWHSDYYPFATSRDTAASAFVAEAGLAPHDVDEVVMVLRAFPIRVGGNSGPLPQEIDWPTLAQEAHLPPGFVEHTSATGRVRRVGRFDPEVVRRALAVNAPHTLIVNHMDYVDPFWRTAGPTSCSRKFVEALEAAIGREVDLFGYDESTLLPRSAVMLSRAA